MKVFNNIFFFISLTLILGCKQKYERVIYNSYGEVSQIYRYVSKAEFEKNESFDKYTYFENGKLDQFYSIIKGQKEGKFLDYDSLGNLECSQMFKNGKCHGINKYYTLKGELSASEFCINNVGLIYMKCFRSNKGITQFYYYINGDSLEDNGQLVYDNSGQINPNESFYYTITSDDDSNSSMIKFDLEVYSFNKRCKIREFLLGDFNEFYLFIDSVKLKRYKSDTNKLSFSLSRKDYEDNLIMGKLYAEFEFLEENKNTIGRSEFIVYHEF